ncbi:neutral zinc metallopeptidase [Kribbella sp. NPDC055071]
MDKPAAAASASVTPTPTPTPTPTLTPTASPSETATATPIGDGVADLALDTVQKKLFAAGKVPAVRCVLPRPDLRTKAKQLTYARAFVACMNAAWKPVVNASDMPFSPPQVFNYAKRKPAATPQCVGPPPGMDAFYNSDGTTAKICISTDDFLDAQGDPTRNVINFEQLLAHEYGHHVQESVGILTVYGDLLTGKSAKGQLEVERRKELQASCLGAAFMGANRSTLGLTGGRLATWQHIVHRVGDESNGSHVRDHGSRTNHAYWTLQAFKTAAPASCNTFTAAANRVS